MRRTVITTIIIAVLASAALFTYLKVSSSIIEDEMFYTEVMRGKFDISVSGAGEIVAENYVDVKGPDIIGNFNFRAAAMIITDIVPEGTIVKKGDYIATIDKSSFSNTLKDESQALDNMHREFELKLIDTAVTLSTLRDDLRDQAFAVEEAFIEVERSVYEPPAVQRKAESDYESNQRHLEQKRRLYWLRMSQASADVRNMKTEIDRQERKVKDLQDILSSFTVKAPADGMVVYKRDRLGNKIVKGSMLHPFNPVVATLPDMSSMQSKTYISEVEVSRVHEGMPVKVTVDALQSRVLDGSVAHIANVGEQLPNSDTKVFEVLISINNTGSGLIPSMTTGNRILVRTYPDAVYIPLESLYTGTENIPYVYTRNGTRQVVIPGDSNEKYVIIEKGLAEGTDIYLARPLKSDKFRLEGIQLVNDMNDRSLASYEVSRGASVTGGELVLQE